MFADETRKEDDPWWQIVKAFEDFNANRKRTIAGSNLKTLDELISAYCPQTTKTGNIPHLSFIIRKPESLKTAQATLHLGDAWFASVDLAYHAKHNLGVNFIGIVKTNSSRYCKKFLNETMATWPGGSHLI